MHDLPHGIRWRMRGWAAALLALAGTLLAAGPPAQARADDTTARERVVVVERPGSGDAAESAVRRLGGTVGRQLPVVHGFTARVSASRVPALRRAAGVRSVSRDRRMRLLSDEAATAPGASLATIRATLGAAQLSRRGAGVDVALIDSGVSPLADLSGRVLNGADISPDARQEDKRFLDGFGHGTHLAGIIAGDGAGISGVAPGSRVVNVKVADHDGMTSLGQVLAGIDWVVRNGRRDGRNVRVINLSIGAEPMGDYRDDPLALAVERAWRSGIVVVAAAGNGGAESAGLDSPAYDPYVIAAGASETAGTADPSDDTVADFSSRGTAERAPDVVAPGVGVVSVRVPGGLLDTAFPAARIGEQHFRGSGTSQAAAVTSAATALLLAERPDLTPDEVKALLRGTARSLGDAPEAQGQGLLAVDRAAVAEVPADARQRHLTATGRGAFKGEVSLELVPHPKGTRWTGTRWTGTRWTGTRWTGTRWTGTRWTGTRWTGTRWTGTRWTGTRWTTAAWEAEPAS